MVRRIGILLFRVNTVLRLFHSGMVNIHLKDLLNI